MNVPQMLELMGTLGVGEGANVIPNDVYIQYLNIANLELYTKTANFNDDILEEFLGQNTAGSNFFDLPIVPHLITNVLPTGQKNPLVKRSRVRFDTYVYENPNSQIQPYIYKRVKNRLTFYPYNLNIVYPMNVYYAPPPAWLTINTQEQDIPYPIAYHKVLVDGALHYLFAGEGGFRSTKNQDRADADYAKGTKSLIAYLQGSNAHHMGTFRNA